MKERGRATWKDKDTDQTVLLFFARKPHLSLFHLKILVVSFKSMRVNYHGKVYWMYVSNRQEEIVISKMLPLISWTKKMKEAAKNLALLVLFDRCFFFCSTSFVSHTLKYMHECETVALFFPIKEQGCKHRIRIQYHSSSQERNQDKIWREKSYRTREESKETIRERTCWQE